jgi:hypothetical protein
VQKAACCVRNALCLKRLSLSDAPSLQVFHLVVTRLRTRTCGCSAAIGLWRLRAAIGGVAAAAANGPLATARGVRALPAVGVWLLTQPAGLALPRLGKRASLPPTGLAHLGRGTACKMRGVPTERVGVLSVLQI